MVKKSLVPLVLPHVADITPTSDQAQAALTIGTDDEWNLILDRDTLYVRRKSDGFIRPLNVNDTLFVNRTSIDVDGWLNAMGGGAFGNEAFFNSNVYIENGPPGWTEITSAVKIYSPSTVKLYTGATLTLGQDPVAALEAATKQYVDANAGSEVYIGTDDPIGSYPSTELWYDTDEAIPLGASERWNTAWGVMKRYAKPTLEGGYSAGTEWPIAALNGVVVADSANRMTRINYGVQIAATTSPAAQSYWTVRLRLGTGAGGAIQESHIHPFGPGQQNFGSGYISLQGTFYPQAFLAGATATLTIFSPSGAMAYDVGANSYMVVEDTGPVGGSIPAVDPAPQWTPMVLANGWTAYGGGWSIPGYRRVGDTVELRGLIRGPGSAETFTTLPVGFRPPNNIIFSTWAANAPQTVRGQTRLEIYSGGAVWMNATYGLSGLTVANIEHISLDGISFSVTP